MSPTPEKAEHDDVFEDVTCPSKSAFPGEPTYSCWIASDRPHTLHDDGEHHRWFDAIPDLPISAYQADFLERFGALGSAERAADAAVRAAREAARGFVLTGHKNTDRVLQEQVEANARTFDELRLSELIRQQDETIREIAANMQTPQHYWPAEYASLKDLTAELRRLDHEIAMVRALSAPYPLSEATLRERREAIRKERAKRAKLEAWYGALEPRYDYGMIPAVPLTWFGGVSSAEAFVEREAPRLAQFEAIREGFEAPFRQMMQAATKEGEKMAKKKIEDLGLPKVEYVTPPGSEVWYPSDPEAAKVDHVMTRNGGEIFGIARVKPVVEWRDPAPLSSLADGMAKIIGSGEIRTRRASLPGEIRTTSSTGGEKGMKPARFDLIPVMPLTRLAEHYGVGAAKYADHNWRKGYELSKNYAALQRHVTAFWDGEDDDPETGTPHLSAVIFHAMAMQQTLQDFPQYDDRYKKEA